MTCHECNQAKESLKAGITSILTYKILAVVMHTAGQPFQLLLQRKQQQLLLHMEHSSK